MGLLLILANCWFPNPLGFAIAVDPHDLNRSTYVRLLLVDLFLDKPPNSTKVGNTRIEYSLRSEDGKSPVGTFAWAGTPSGEHMPSIAGDAEFYDVRNQSSGVFSVDNNAHDRPLLGSYFARWKIGFKNVVQQWHHLFHERGYSTVQRASRLNGPLGKGLKVNSLPSRHAHYGEVHLSSVPNLAGIRLFVAFGVGGPAVSGNHDFHIGPYESYGSAVQGAFTGDKGRNGLKHEQPKWIRHRYLSPTICWRDRGGDTTCSGDSEDIDVSLDGKKWFHAMGEYCPDRLPEWRFGIR